MQAQFSEFVKLLGDCPDEQKVRLLALFDSLINNQQDFIRFLINECDYDEDEDDCIAELEFGITYDIRDGIYQLLCYFLDGYNDDWKISYNYLEKYITLCIGKEFVINDYDYHKARQQLESQSEFTLFQIFNIDENVGIWVVKKSDRPTLLELAKSLGLEVY